MTRRADKPRALSAFSGMGGLDLGVEAAGFAIVGCIEWDEEARRTLKANSGGNWPILMPADISQLARELMPADLGMGVGDLELLCGAPPCQPFSKAGQWASGTVDGLGDPRAQYLDDFLHLVRTFQPEAVLIENVIGFIRGRNSALEHLTGAFAQINAAARLNYKLTVMDLDASEYGVPQRRRRAFVVAVRTGESVVEPAPTHSDDPVTAWDAIGDLATDGPRPQMTGKWAGLLPSVPEGSNYLFHTERGDGLPLFGWRTRYWSFLLKLARNQPSWTLPASPGPATGPFHWDNRPLTIEEMLVLQSFPRGYIVEAGSRREAVRQIGNATPPLLAEVLGRSVLSAIRPDHRFERELKYRLGRSAVCPAPSPPTRVPLSYRRLIGDYDEHPGTGLGPGALRARESSDAKRANS